MRKRSNQCGASDVTLLFAFVILVIVVVVALPKYLKWREASNVPAEVRLLRRVYAAEQRYRARISHNQTYGSLKTLVNAGILPETCAACDDDTRPIDGLRLSLSRNYEETRFCAQIAGGGSGKNYALDADGRLYENGDCAMGEVAGGNLLEAK